MKDEVQVVLVSVDLAIKRYLEHGSYPRNPQLDIVPGYLKLRPLYVPCRRLRGLQNRSGRS
jgi:hypothetical protein